MTAYSSILIGVELRNQLSYLCLLAPDAHQLKKINHVVEYMLEWANKNGFPEIDRECLLEIFFNRIELFQISVSSGPPAQLPTLRINPNYTYLANRMLASALLSSTTVTLTCYDHQDRVARMAYLNPSISWASTPLFVPEPGKARFRFTEDRRAVNLIRDPHQYSMLSLEIELSKLLDLTIFANLDLCH